MKYIFTFLSVLLLSSIAISQPGTLDSSYGTNGKTIVVTKKGVTQNIYKAIIQKDDKVIAIGSLNNPSAGIQGLAAYRFMSDGSLDNTFGDSGNVVYGFNFDIAEGYCGAIQTDGKILIAGYEATGLNPSKAYGLIIRLNSDGSIDPSFGENGMVLNTYSAFTSLSSILIQPDNKIVVSGLVGAGNSLVTRYLSDGTTDISFGDNGTAIYINGGLLHSALQDDGKIILGGGAGSSSKALLVRYNTNGSLDASFGTEGKIILGDGINGDEISDIAIQKDNMIVAFEQLQSYVLNSYSAVIRFLPDGQFDNDFGHNGIDSIIVTDTTTRAESLLLQNDGAIVLASGASAHNTNYTNFLLMRLKANGTTDSSFGINGKTITEFGENSFLASAVFQSDSKIVAVGGNLNIDISRYNNDGLTKKQILITKIRHWIQRRNGIEWDNTSSAGSYIVQRSYDGIHWSTVHRQQTKVNGQQSTVNYYNDPAPLNGANYYRLQTTNVSGAVTNSNVIAISNYDIKISPNPATGSLQIQGLTSSQKTKLTVIDLSGNIQLQAVANASSYDLNIALLHAGNYVIKIETNGEVVTKQFVKQ